MVPMIISEMDQDLGEADLLRSYVDWMWLYPKGPCSDAVGGR